jgi:hypothetical protein
LKEDEQNYLTKKAFVQDNSPWVEEEEKWVKNKFGEPYKVVRLIYKRDQEDKKQNPRRLISITKKNKSVGIDMESVFGLTAAMRLLADDFVSDRLK